MSEWSAAEPAQTKGRRRPYSSLSTPEKWEYHTNYYAFLAVYLGLNNGYSALDPEGKWFDQRAVALATERKRRELDEKMRRRREKRERRYRDMQLEGRAFVNEWAKKRSYADLDAYCAATNQPWEDVYRQIINGIMAQSVAAKAKIFNRDEDSERQRRYEAKVDAEWEDPQYAAARQSEAP